MRYKQDLYLRIYGWARRVLYSKESSGLRSILMIPLSIPGYINFFLAGTRRKCYRLGIFRKEKVEALVIGVGNLTLGGSGKTTITMELAEYLRERGFAVGILSRGYSGKKSGRKPVVVSKGSGPVVSVRDAGDEPYMMADQLGRDTTVVIGKDRVAAARRSVKELKREVLILDDSYQYLALHKDLEILLVNERDLTGRVAPFPAGIFREPFSSAVDADVIVVMRWSGTENCPDTSRLPDNSRVIITEAVPVEFDLRLVWPKVEDIPVKHLRGSRLIAFSSIARTALFRQFLSRLEAELLEYHEFPDHYYYGREEIEDIGKQAIEQNAAIVTTEKDRVKVPWDVFEQVECYTLIPRYRFFERNREIKNRIDELLEQRNYRESESTGI